MPTQSSADLGTRAMQLATAAVGDGLALLSAIFYAIYVILLKVRIKEESRIDMQLFFGFVGLFNVLLLWPIGIILHLSGSEVFEFPHGRKALVAVCLNVSTSGNLCGASVKIEYYLQCLDVNHVIQRLHLCTGYAQDYTLGGDDRVESNDSTGNYRRLFLENSFHAASYLRCCPCSRGFCRHWSGKFACRKFTTGVEA